MWRDTSHSPKLLDWSFTIRHSIISRTVTGREFYSSAQILSVDFTAPNKRGVFLGWKHLIVQLFNYFVRLIFTHIYIYIYIYRHTHTHTRTHIYIYLNIYTHIYIYICSDIYICVCVCVCIHIHTHTHILPTIPMGQCVYTYTHTLAHWYSG